MSFRDPGGSYFEPQQPARRPAQITKVLYYSTLSEALFDMERAAYRREIKIAEERQRAAGLALEAVNSMLAELGAGEAQKQAEQSAVLKPKVYMHPAAVDGLRNLLQLYPAPVAPGGIFAGMLVGCNILDQWGDLALYLYEFSDPQSSQTFRTEEGREMLGEVHVQNRGNEVVESQHPLIFSIAPTQRRIGVYRNESARITPITRSTVEIESVEFG